MPEEGIDLVPMVDVLTYEEIREIVRVAVSMGLRRVRLTGGEPLARKRLEDLVGMITALPSIEEVALSTNGVVLARHAESLARAGLSRVNVSLDTLRPERFREITRGGRLADVLDGIDAAQEVGLTPIKLNVVVMRGLNDDEVVEFARSTLDRDWQVRFIELMPFTALENTGQQPARASAFVSNESVRRQIEAALGPLQPESGDGNGPARYYRLAAAKGKIGFHQPADGAGFLRALQSPAAHRDRQAPPVPADRLRSRSPGVLARRRRRRRDTAGYNDRAGGQAGRPSPPRWQPAATPQDGADRGVSDPPRVVRASRPQRVRWAQMAKLSHLDESSGRARMVDVTAKRETAREAVAAGTVRMRPETLALIQSGGVAKGDVIAVAQVAGVMAAKRTCELIPMCHPLLLTNVDVQIQPDERESALQITATVRTTGKTGVEMEALTAVMVAALTIYDMCKAVERGIRIESVRLLKKSGGKSGNIVLR